MRPTRQQLLKAALNIEAVLAQMPRKKPISRKEEMFRNALGVRLKVKK